MEKKNFVRMYLPCTLFCLLLVAAKVSAFLPTTGGPPDGQQNIPIDALIDRQFDRPFTNSTVNTTNVHLKTNTGNVSGGAPTGGNLCDNIIISGGDRLICEHLPLDPETWYTFTITTGVQTSTGYALPADITYEYRTSDFGGAVGEYVSPPTIDSSVPRAGGTMPINGKIRVYFDPGGSGTGTTMKTVGAGSVFDLESVKLKAAVNGQPSGANMLACSSTGADVANPTDCNMAWNATNKELIITPGKKAPAGTVDSTGGSTITAGASYILIIEGPSGGGWSGVGGVRNSEDMPMMDQYYWANFTAAATDNTGPDVQGTYPQNNSTGVDRALYDMSIGFNDALDPATVSGGSIRFYCEDNDGNGGNGCNAGTDGWDANDTEITTIFVDYDTAERSAIVSPSSLLAASTKYYVRVTSDVKDIVGNRFDGDTVTVGNQAEVITFTTSANINGGVSDTDKPQLMYANADNFSIAATFSEPMKFDAAANLLDRPSTGPNDVNNLNNWAVESPPGSPASLMGKSIFYDPKNLTLTIEGFSLPPNQTVRIKAQTATGAIYIKDLSGNAVSDTGSGNLADATVQSVQDSGGQLGPGAHSGEFDFFSFGMKPVMVFPRTALAGATS
ncbi:Ig-like domain-containing protein, partial [Patescibacteria group bacterium]|nr:Ig-like domain-containing protein [Patescibacteria group bacterium]